MDEIGMGARGRQVVADVTVAQACRACESAGIEVFLSLGDMPLPDALVRPEDVNSPEPRYPLDVAFCTSCSLVQILQEVPPKKLFVDNYLYFSSFSDELLRHSRRHAFELIDSRGLNDDSLVVEIASNDGYLLRNFVERGIPVLGIDPAPEQAKAAEAVGVPTLPQFFDATLAAQLRAEGRGADVIIANNVMAHTPKLRSFVEGLRILLVDDGIATIENPSVKELIERGAFDTIYHEHFSYFSCTAVEALMRRAGLTLQRVEAFELHGGTLRWTVGTRDQQDPSVPHHLEAEAEKGMTSFDYYRAFAGRVESAKDRLRALLLDLKAQGKTIAAYGAAAKGTILLNYADIGVDLVDFVVDRNVHKHGLLMPGVHLPVRSPDALVKEMPDYVLVLAWNFADEIVAQQGEYRRRGGAFIVPVPEPRVVT